MRRNRLATVGLLSLGLGLLPVSALRAEDILDAPSRLTVTADFNRDGIPDLAEVAPADDAAPRLLTVLLGQPDGGFHFAGADLEIGKDPRSLAVGDFNRDGIPDLLVGDGDGKIAELLGDGTGRLVASADVAHLGSVSAIAVADFNHDGVLDLAVSDSRESVVAVLVGSANGSFQKAWSFPLPARGKAFRVFSADFNGDGLPDLAVTNDDDGSFQVMLSNGNGTFTFAPLLSKTVDPSAHCAT